MLRLAREYTENNCAKMTNDHENNKIKFYQNNNDAYNFSAIPNHT